MWRIASGKVRDGALRRSPSPSAAQGTRTVTHHYPPTKPANPAADAGTEFVMTNKDFEANVDLWLNPGVPAHDADITYANFVFQSTLRPVDFNRLATRVTGLNSPAFMFCNRNRMMVYTSASQPICGGG
ncbi:MAG: hypothetical protein PHY43_04945 [Verrucomicrobiales bacterium]|nr:hypothetical protein [Verrucomicrobiales bacterium]